jgi:putative transposase
MKSRTKCRGLVRRTGEVEVQLTLPMAGVLRDVQQAFLGLCVKAGKEVLAAMMEADRQALCGPRGKPDAQRLAHRGGHTQSSVVMGGQRIAIRRPRVRAIEDGELQLPTFEWAAAADPLERATMHAVAAGVSTRRYRTTQDKLPEGETGKSTSKSAVSRRFVALSEQQMHEWLSRDLSKRSHPTCQAPTVRPDPSLERTSIGKPLGPRNGECHHPVLGRSALPLASAQLKRCRYKNASI